jgi:hypothetical protein
MDIRGKAIYVLEQVGITEKVDVAGRVDLLEQINSLGMIVLTGIIGDKQMMLRVQMMETHNITIACP